MRFRPSKRIGLFVGLLIIGTILAVGAYLWSSLKHQGIGLGLFLMALLFGLSLVLLLLWCYWYLELVTLRYSLDRNRLCIDWLSGSDTIPLAAIDSVSWGTNFKLSRGLQGVGWPGYMKGSLLLSDGSELLTHSTEPLERQIVVSAGKLHYGISPKNTEGFMAALNRHRALGALRTEPFHRDRSAWLRFAIWRGRLYWMVLGLGLLLNLALIGWVMHRYTGLPARIPLHFDAAGQADRIADKAWLFMLPGIGLLVAAVNSLLGVLLYGRERVAAYLLGIASLAAQVVLWLATFEILMR